MVIGACILSLVIFIIGAILGAGETSTAQGARSEHRDDNGDRNENSEGAGNQEAKASPDQDGHSHGAAEAAFSGK
jgi:hypothetical protein